MEPRAHIAFDSDRALLPSDSWHLNVTPFPTVLRLTHSESANVFVKRLKKIWLQNITHRLPLQVLQSEERFILLVTGIEHNCKTQSILFVHWFFH